MIVKLILPGKQTDRIFSHFMTYSILIKNRPRLTKVQESHTILKAVSSFRSRRAIQIISTIGEGNPEVQQPTGTSPIGHDSGLGLRKPSWLRQDEGRGVHGNPDSLFLKLYGNFC